MNYYERHIGDYSKNASHLSLLEHGIYVRLIDVYYTKEAPIPEDKAARWIGAVTEAETQALQVVLQEFFVLRNGRWHQSRCDEEIASYAQGEPEREVKKANEDNRLKRHREERAELFKKIVAAGRHAHWNTAIADLRKLAAECVAGVAVAGSETPAATLPATAPATPATATHSPLPTSQYPLHNEKQDSVPIGTAGEPAEKPLTAREQAWALGVALLGESPSTRTLLGKLAKSPGEEILAEVLAEATLSRPVEPKSWLIATCAARAKNVPRAGAQEQGDLLADPKPAWALNAGFSNRFDAENAGCKQSNAAKFRGGRRIEAA